MSKSKHTYTDLSDTHKCRVCNKAIKERLIEIKTVKPTLCYKHYKNEITIYNQFLSKKERKLK